MIYFDNTQKLTLTELHTQQRALFQSVIEAIMNGPISKDYVLEYFNRNQQRWMVANSVNPNTNRVYRLLAPPVKEPELVINRESSSVKFVNCKALSSGTYKLVKVV